MSMAPRSTQLCPGLHGMPCMCIKLKILCTMQNLDAVHSWFDHEEQITVKSIHYRP